MAVLHNLENLGNLRISPGTSNKNIDDINSMLISTGTTNLDISTRIIVHSGISGDSYSNIGLSLYLNDELGVGLGSLTGGITAEHSGVSIIINNKIPIAATANQDNQTNEITGSGTAPNIQIHSAPTTAQSVINKQYFENKYFSGELHDSSIVESDASDSDEKSNYVFYYDKSSGDLTILG